MIGLIGGGCATTYMERMEREVVMAFIDLSQRLEAVANDLSTFENAIANGEEEFKKTLQDVIKAKEEAARIRATLQSSKLARPSGAQLRNYHSVAMELLIAVEDYLDPIEKAVTRNGKLEELETASHQASILVRSRLEKFKAKRNQLILEMNYDKR